MNNLLRKKSLAIVLGFVGLCLTDAALLLLLPVWRISFSTEIQLPLAASWVARSGLLVGLGGAALILHQRAAVNGSYRRLVRPAMGLFWVANLGLSAVEIDAYVIEPLWVQTTSLSFSSPQGDAAAPPVRIVHLTDLHIERYGRREESLAARVNALKPDIIVITGDHLNMSNTDDPVSAADFRRLMAQLDAPYGIYATRGTVDPRTPAQVAWLLGPQSPVTWLSEQIITLDVRGQTITLVGVTCSHHYDNDARRLDETMRLLKNSQPSPGFTILLYHSPDLIAEAQTYPIDLYLAGHTHGGQIRLPFWGAIVTNSTYGKKYEAGLFHEGNLFMYVSRGIGLEGWQMPRARFLCPPEVVNIEIKGNPG